MLVALAGLVVVVPSLAFLPVRQAPTLVDDTAQPGAPSRIVWEADPAADYYVVEFLIDGRVAAVVRSSLPSITTPSFDQSPALWRVFAGYGPVSRHDTRGPIASGTTGCTSAAKPLARAVALEPVEA